MCYTNVNSVYVKGTEHISERVKIFWVLEELNLKLIVLTVTTGYTGNIKKTARHMSRLPAFSQYSHLYSIN